MPASRARPTPVAGALLAGALLGSGGLAAQPLQLWLDLTAQGVRAESPRSWLDGGFGRLSAGGEDDPGGDIERTAARGLGALGLLWSPDPSFGALLHLQGRAEPTAGGDAIGMVEAWAEGIVETRAGADRLRLRGGQFFLPTSRENVGPLWSSPYTLTLSALNSWIGEEIRPLGLLVDYELGAAAPRGWRGGAAAVYGNDAAGALLAWRGWAMGDRLSGLGETLPLPPLPSLAPGGRFAEQDPAGTAPIGADLDGRPGWAAFVRWRGEAATAPRSGLVQLTHFDNRGDRGLHDGEYAWDTRFDLAALELRHGEAWVLAGEWMRGRTRMGPAPPPADLDFAAAYLLLSYERLPLRLTLRHDRFSTTDRDRLPAAERNDEDGAAWTAALTWQASPRLRVLLEAIDLAVDRALIDGAARRAEDGRALTLALRYRLGSAAQR